MALEIILELLAERSPRSPHELVQAVDRPPAEVYAALNAASWQVERCAPHPCIGSDFTCPCQDGDSCHYRDDGAAKAMAIPAGAQPNVWWWRLTAHAVAERKARAKREATAPSP